MINAARATTAAMTHPTGPIAITQDAAMTAARAMAPAAMIAHCAPTRATIATVEAVARAAIAANCAPVVTAMRTAVAIHAPTAAAKRPIEANMRFVAVPCVVAAVRNFPPRVVSAAMSGPSRDDTSPTTVIHASSAATVD
ncbi:hypothetical protein [Saccharopolyspora sp. 6V]|uniref:hypothetical protein n=1 Tax=Saccharopolyspora sp. 6V TaxID=2877239 RepID=UPI001CD40568|nr:hypothetical protein [Saccharopolyspora sp. 6V]MCA1195137.1 hypothetical protein [Saccharopolyspora sp. 6V]